LAFRQVRRFLAVKPCEEVESVFCILTNTTLQVTAQA